MKIQKRKRSITMKKVFALLLSLTLCVGLLSACGGTGESGAEELALRRQQHRDPRVLR